MSSTTPIPATTVTNPNFLSQYIPNYDELVGKAGSNINDLLSGNLSPAIARNSAASFGVSSGMPGSGLADRYGYDLYNQQAQQRQQAGLSDLNSLIGSISTPTLSSEAQNLQNQQFYSNLNQQANEFNTSEIDNLIRSIQGL